MNNSFTLGLLLVLFSALVGGYFAKILKQQPVIGYIVAGVVAGNIFPLKELGINSLAELGAILLLFSIGLEFSLNKFGGLFKKILIASILQLLICSVILLLAIQLLGFAIGPSVIISVAFSLSSTAVVMKILFDRAEVDSIHGKLMLGWLLVQDLAVVPIMVTLPYIQNISTEIWLPILFTLIKSVLLVVVSLVLGKHIVPFVIHKVAQVNSRELLLLTSVCLALGTAFAVSSMGISATLGAFLAGLVISESQENHAVFAETRPLRDLFVAMFFVTLGFFVNFGEIRGSLGIILVLAALILLVKSIIILFLSILVGFRGKTAITTSLGLSQVGEFAFVIITAASVQGILSEREASIAIFTSLLTLILTPFLFKSIIPLWRKVKFVKILSTGIQTTGISDGLTNHIIICGYGRVGGWVGKALESQNIPFVVIEYDQNIVSNLKTKGVSVVYGDPTENEVLDAAGVKDARAVVVAIPDRFAQESIIAYIQTKAPNAKIISRVHLDEDWDKLKQLQVDKLVQPEFEAATEILKSILRSLGRDRESIKISVKNLRLSHAKI